MGVFREVPDRLNSGIGLLGNPKFILPLLVVARLLVFMTIVIARLFLRLLQSFGERDGNRAS